MWFIYHFSLLTPIGSLRQIVVAVRNLMRHRSHLFERLKVVEKIRAYMTHGLHYQKELLAKIAMAKIAKGVAWKAVVEGIGLLTKAEMKNHML